MTPSFVLMVHSFPLSVPLPPCFVPSPITINPSTQLPVGLLRKVQIVAQPLPPQDLVNAEAGVAVCQWQEECPSKSDKCQDNHAGNPGRDHARTGESLAGRNVPLGTRNLLLGTLAGRNFRLGCVVVEDKFNKSTCHQR